MPETTIANRLKARAAADLDVVGLGECSIDEVWVLPDLKAAAPGEKLRASRRERLGGGQVATAMVAAARLGLRASFIGAVGDDASGVEALAGLRAEGVDVTRALTIPGGATRAALVLVDERSGERTVLEHTDRRVTVHPLSLAVDRVHAARVLHVDATDLPAAIMAARAAREHGTLVSLDVDHPRPGLDELLALTDVCITSQRLPHELTGEQELEVALRKLRERTAGLVVCTLGAAGAAALDEGHLVLSPAFPADPVDTTACGDTFHAAFLCALLEGAPVGQMLRFANAAASLKCRDLGRRGCPTRAEIDGMLAHA